MAAGTSVVAVGVGRLSGYMLKVETKVLPNAGCGVCDQERKDDSKVFGLHNGNVELPLTGTGKGGVERPMKSQFGRVKSEMPLSHLSGDVLRQLDMWVWSPWERFVQKLEPCKSQTFYTLIM